MESLRQELAAKTEELEAAQKDIDSLQVRQCLFRSRSKIFIFIRRACVQSA